MKKLKAVKSSSEQEGIATIHRDFIRHPMFQSRVKVSASDVVGNAALGWHRGRQSGIFDSYRTLVNAYPEAAKSLLRAYRMTKEGSYL